MSKIIHRYDCLAECYVEGELGEVVQGKETVSLSGELDALILANTSRDVADRLIGLLSAYSAACQRDGFIGGLNVGIRVGLAAAGKGLRVRNSKGAV